MKVWKGISWLFRLLEKIFISVIAFPVTYLFCALFFSLLPTHPPEKDCPVSEEVYISGNGVHLDIIVPVDRLKPSLLSHLELLPGTRFVAFGWGDKEFYIKTPEWSDLTLPVAFRAVFLKSESAMHVTCLPRLFPECKRIGLCSWQMERLNCYIQNSFKRDESGNILKLNFEGYSPYDSFYDARGSFSLFRTCNVWVGRALKEIEVKTSVWSPFEFGILFHVR
jgi:uncharacterized protein (TIGR02117 family)